MIILFVRHAEAEDPATFGGDDMDRPLTAEGRKRAKRMFKKLARFYPGLDLILFSEARRAQETARLLAKRFPHARQEMSASLNPGCMPREFLKLAGGLGGGIERLAVVGHEPDISRILAAIVAGGTLNIEIKKAALAEIEVNKIGHGTLRMLIPPRVWNGTP